MSVWGSVWGQVWGSVWGSVGPEAEELNAPLLIGRDLIEALSVLTPLGLELSSAQGYSDTIAVGLIVSQSPDAGTVVEVGDTIIVIVSFGPSPKYTRLYWAAKRKRSENTV